MRSPAQRLTSAAMTRRSAAARPGSRSQRRFDVKGRLDPGLEGELAEAMVPISKRPVISTACSVSGSCAHLGQDGAPPGGVGRPVIGRPTTR